MSHSPVISMLRQRRSAAGLSQGELAERIGVSRQALSAIEAGRQVPSTALALELSRALHCKVDDLFRLARGPVVQARLAPSNRSGITRAVVGRIDGQWVAHAALDGARSADGILLESPEGREAATVELLSAPANMESNVLVAGCAPLLGALADRLGRRYRDARATWLFANSTRALELLERGLVHVAGIHLADAAKPDANVRAAQRALAARRITLVHLARWRQGLVIARRNPRSVETSADLLRPDIRCAIREAGAGARILLERLLRKAGEGTIDEHDTRCVLASDHSEVARLVRWGVADAGVAIESAALAEGLEFLPLSEERFDLLIPERYLDLPPVARLVDLIAGPTFQAEAAGFQGYDLSTTGDVSTVPAL